MMLQETGPKEVKGRSLSWINGPSFNLVRIRVSKKLLGLFRWKFKKIVTCYFEMTSSIFLPNCVICTKCYYFDRFAITCELQKKGKDYGRLSFIVSRVLFKKLPLGMSYLNGRIAWEPCVLPVLV